MSSKKKIKVIKEQPVKERLVCLNLGCGDKIITCNDKIKWVNVDFQAHPRPVFIPALVQGQGSPEVYCIEDDVRTLGNIADNYADEVHAYHVIEHIPVYEIEDTLLRWFAILKPGGRIVLEQPDIVKSCINLLQMITTRDNALVNNLGMYGIYGQPTPENKGMEHKWGWIPDTLGQVLLNCGFKDITTPPPTTHQGPKRDFRIEARKPF